MKKFPKTIYVTRDTDDEEAKDFEYYIDETKEKAVETTEVDSFVAVYQLVKVGKVEEKRRIVYE